MFLAKKKGLYGIMREQIIKEIEEEKIIAIIRGVTKEKLVPLVGALKRGGIKFVEVTYSANKKVSDEATAEMIGMLVKEYGDEMYIGAGTVLEESQVDLTKETGGQFIISPDVNEQVIKRTRELEMVSMPGGLTPSEITAASRYGADFVKLFPISNLGSGYVKAVKAPLSNIKLLAVGGIHDKNMEEYYKAGCVGFGIGSNITDKKMIENDDWQGVENLAKSYVEVVRNLK